MLNIRVNTELYDSASLLATESFGLYIREIATFFTDRLHNISNIFTSNSDNIQTLKDANNNNAIIKELLFRKSDYNRIVSKSGQLKLSKVENIDIPVLVGLRNVNYIVVLDYIQSNMEIGIKSTLDNLVETDQLVANMLSDKNTRVELKKYEKNTARTIADTIMVNIETLVDANGTADLKPFKVIFPSMASFELVYNKLIAIDKLLPKNYLTDLDNRVTSLYKKVNELVGYFNTRSEDIKVSQAALLHMSDALETTAVLVTAIVSNIYLYNQVTESFTRTVELISNDKYYKNN